jgi:hypothetical protein
MSVEEIKAFIRKLPNGDIKLNRLLELEGKLYNGIHKKPNPNIYQYKKILSDNEKREINVLFDFFNSNGVNDYMINEILISNGYRF